jgi:hypothetical protein
MAITNYGELKTAVQTWMFDAGDIGTNAADMVTLAQGYLNRRIRCRDMITQADITPTAGLFTIPSDFLQPRHVAELFSTSRRPLRLITLERADRLYPDREAGQGIWYAIIGSSIRVFPTITNDIELTYYARLGAFASDSATDWLLTKFPNLYLSAACMYAAEFLKDDAEVQKQASIVEMYVSMLNSEDDAAELADAEYIAEGFNP